jgi:hypothetical protein
MLRRNIAARGGILHRIGPRSAGRRPGPASNPASGAARAKRSGGGRCRIAERLKSSRA